MANEITQVDDPLGTQDPQGGVLVTLPKAIHEDPEVLRWLNHWVVDVMADTGHVTGMVVDVQERLGTLGVDIVIMFVADLVRQAIEAASKPEEAQPPKKAKKRKRK